MMRFFMLMGTVALVLPLTAAASPLVRVADAITLGSTELVVGDWYSAGGTVTLSGTIDGDAYVTAGTVTVNAPVKQDLVVLGGAVRVNANVGDDIRVLSGDVTISGTVGGDVIVLAGTLHLTDTARIAGDLIVMAETATIEGDVAGDLFARASTLSLGGNIGGDVRVPEAHAFALTKSADIKGSLTYSAPSVLEQAETAKVAGKIEYTPTALPGVDFSSIVSLILTMMLLAGAVHGIFAKKLAHMITVTHTRTGTAALVGIGGFLAAPLLALFLLVLTVTAPLGIILFALFIAYTVAAGGFAAIILGLYAYRLYEKTMIPTWTTTLIGAVLVGVLTFTLPLISAFIILTVPLGVLLLETYRVLITKGK